MKVDEKATCEVAKKKLCEYIDIAGERIMENLLDALGEFDPGTGKRKKTFKHKTSVDLVFGTRNGEVTVKAEKTIKNNPDHYETSPETVKPSDQPDLPGTSDEDDEE